MTKCSLMFTLQRLHIAAARKQEQLTIILKGFTKVRNLLSDAIVTV